MKDKLWGGRFSEATNKLVEKYTASLLVEPRLALFDIQGSKAHCKMLAFKGIISDDEKEQILNGLEQIKQEFIEDKFIFDISDEDIHMAIEKRLKEIIGTVAGKLHTARSRNDQTTLDSHLQMRAYIKDIIKELKNLQSVIIKQAQDNLAVIMPGFTHLQTAQPILFSHWIMAYFWMLNRDIQRFNELYNRLDECPLGAAALAGTTFDIDRFFVANELNFSKVSENSIDTVSNRDHMIEFCSISAICFSHFSRLCEELILFMSNEYKFIELSDDFCTGSSIMPQKKNPDVCEKMRGKSGRMYGNLMAMLTIMKGLPLAYNTDMSEDKAQVYDSMDTLYDSVIILGKMLEKMKINADIMKKAAMDGFSNATDLADYLAKKGVAFRNAHEITGKIVNYAIKNNKKLEEIDLKTLQEFCNQISDDIYENISLITCVNKRVSYGGTSSKMVKLQIQNALKELQKA